MNQVTSYEITFIVKEDQKSDDIKKILLDSDAQITAEQDLGQRALAYEIKKATQGHYFRIVFDCDRETIKKIEKDLQRQSLALRFLIVTALRKSKYTGERRLPEATAAKQAEATKVELGKVVEKKAEEPKIETKIEEKEEKTEPVEIKDNVPDEPAEEKAETGVEVVAKPAVKKAAKTEKPVEKPKRIVRKATKAEASELDKKLEELVKED